MFEKEAEEYADKTRVKDKNTYIGFPDESIIEVQDYEGNRIDIRERIEKSFKDGAEFGYNKANEWHYMKDVNCYEDLPHNEDVYYAYVVNVCEYDKPKIERRLGSFAEFEFDVMAYHVIAWKEIVLPELKESEIKSEMFPEIILPEGSAEFVDKVIADAEKRLKGID